MKLLYKLWMRICLERMNFWNDLNGTYFMGDSAEDVNSEEKFQYWSSQYSKALGKVGL